MNRDGAGHFARHLDDQSVTCIGIHSRSWKHIIHDSNARGVAGSSNILSLHLHNKNQRKEINWLIKFNVWYLQVINIYVLSSWLLDHTVYVWSQFAICVHRVS